MKTTRHHDEAIETGVIGAMMGGGIVLAGASLAHVFDAPPLGTYSVLAILVAAWGFTAGLTIKRNERRWNVPFTADAYMDHYGLREDVKAYEAAAVAKWGPGTRLEVDVATNYDGCGYCHPGPLGLSLSVHLPLPNPYSGSARVRGRARSETHPEEAAAFMAPRRWAVEAMTPALLERAVLHFHWKEEEEAA